MIFFKAFSTASDKSHIFVMFLYQLEFVYNRDDFSEEIRTYVSQVNEVLRVYFGPIEIRTAVLCYSLCLHELKKHQAMIAVS